MKTFSPINKIFCSTLVFLILTNCNLFAQDGTKQNIRAQVMVLGSYHMHNPGADVFNVEADDVLAPGRQSEIKQVVSVLKSFAPTMISLEIKRGSKRDSSGLADYQAYLQGDFELGRWEGHQIGYRLAKELDHHQIHHIDENGQFPFQKMMDYAEDNGQMDWVNRMMSKMSEKTEEQQNEAGENTIDQILYKMNRPAELATGHSIYVAGSQIGKGDDFPGADLLSKWYQRNARIFANLYRLTEGKTDEKILVIFGAGHAHILRELIRSAPEFELVEATDYLKPISRSDDFASLLRFHLDAVENKDSLSLKSTLNMGGAYHLILPDGSRMETAQDFYNMHVDWFKDSTWTMEMSVLQAALKGDLGTAFVQADYREPDRDGKPYHHKMWITYMCEKIEGEWKVTHDHCSTASKEGEN